MSIRPEQKYGDEYAKLLKYLTEEAGLNLNSAKQHLIDVANDLIEPKHGLKAIFEPCPVKTVENTPKTVENTTETVENTTETVENTPKTVENTTEIAEEAPKKRAGKLKKQV